MRILLITGLPATGKTTLARRLAAELGAPLLAKDLIKEPLLDALGAGDAEHSRRLSDLSFDILFALLREAGRAGTDVVLEGNFRAGAHEPALLELQDARIAQVLCRVDEEERQARMRARAGSGDRHAGHGDLAAPPNPVCDTYLELPGPRLLYQQAGAETPLLQSLRDWWRGAPGSL